MTPERFLCISRDTQTHKHQEMQVRKNIGNADRVIRILAAVVVAVLLLTGTLSGALGLVLGIAGAVLLFTAFVSICPLYMLLGISTKKAPGAK